MVQLWCHGAVLMFSSLLCTSGIVGSGLCVFSRYQIMEAFSHSFRVTGGVKDFTDGEVFVGKGVLCCRIKTPDGCIAFFNTHVCTRTLVLVSVCMPCSQSACNLTAMHRGGTCWEYTAPQIAVRLCMNVLCVTEVLSSACH